MIFNKPPGIRWVSVCLPPLFYGTLIMEGTHAQIRQSLLNHWRDREHWDISGILPEEILIKELPKMTVPKAIICGADKPFMDGSVPK